MADKLSEPTLREPAKAPWSTFAVFEIRLFWGPEYSPEAPSI